MYKLYEVSFIQYACDNMHVTNKQLHYSQGSIAWLAFIMFMSQIVKAKLTLLEFPVGNRRLMPITEFPQQLCAVRAVRI